MLRRQPIHWTMGFLAAAVLITACGTRVPGQIAALHVARSGAAAIGTVPAGGSGGQISSSADGGGVAGPNASRSSAASTPFGGTVVGGSTGASTNKSGQGLGMATNGGNFGTGLIASKAPVVVGEIGTWSGVIGSAYAPARDAFGAWASWVNAHGGVLGHPIKVLVADDNNDNATDVSAAQTMVQDDHAIALVNAFPAGGDASALAQYAKQANIPVIGGAASAGPWFQSPVMFPTSAGTSGTVPYDYAKVMVSSGLHKVGAVYCVEATPCHLAEQLWASAASQLGLDVVYQGGISLTQPDYTAQCLQAQSAGAQAMFVLADGDSELRFANSCSQQNYHPLMGDSTPGAVSAELNGAFSVVQGFPWMITSGTPALDEYGQAMALYDHNPSSGESSLGWDSGKLLEAALDIALSRSTIPSTAGLFQALWSIRNDTLGGLTPSLTFPQGQPAIEPRCSFEVVVSNSQWVAPSGATPSLCKPS